MKDIVGADGSERLSGSDFVASKDAGGADIAVHRIIGTMFDDDDPQTAVLADCADFAVIDATGLAAVGAQHSEELLHNDISTGDRMGKEEIRTVVGLFLA